MAVIPLPATTRFAKKIEWTLDRPAQVNRSQWTGKPDVIANPWHGIWRAQVDLVPIIGEANMLAWRAFLAKLKGQINTFRLIAVEGSQTATGGIIVHAGAALGATTLLTQPWPPSVTVLTAGQMFTVNDQLCILTADAVSDGTGFAIFTFEAALRAAAVAGTAITVGLPTCLVALTGSSVSWAVEPGKIYGIGSLQVEERW